MIPSLRFAPTTRRGGGTDPIFPLITKKKRKREGKIPIRMPPKADAKIFRRGKKKKKIKFEKKNGKNEIKRRIPFEKGWENSAAMAGKRCQISVTNYCENWLEFWK